MDRKVAVDIKVLIEHALDNYSELDFNREEVVEQIMNFFNERVKICLKI